MTFQGEVRRGLRRVPATLGLLLVAVAVAVAPGGALDLPPILGPQPEPAPTRPRGVIEPPAWDFGDVEAGGRSDPQTFIVRNEGTADFNASVTVTGPFSVVRTTCMSQRLGPGDSCEVDAVFNLEQAYGTGTEEQSGSLGIATYGEDVDHSAAVLTGRSVMNGYYLTSAEGRVYAYGGAVSHGDARGVDLQAPILGLAATPTGRGYWLVAADGGLFSFGDARFFGSTGNLRLNSPIVGMAPTATGSGYWMVAEDGGVFCFGDARFHGSKGGSGYPEPFVAITPTPSGGGYWLLAADGEVFPFGDAGSFGSAGAIPLEAPILSMAATPTGGGYWLVSAEGAVFSFGDARYHGALDANDGFTVVVGIARPGTGAGGYWLADLDGKVFPFGTARNYGSVDPGEFGYGENRSDGVLDIEAAPVPPR